MVSTLGKADRMSGKTGGKRPIIIRREEIVEAGHHGGAWKVAYADFVTAMMAFFLLMWLLNATTDEQRRGLADYFSPMNPIARGASGSGQPFGGKTPFDNGEMVSDRGTMAVMQGRQNDQPDTDEPTPEVSVSHALRNNLNAAADGGGTRPSDQTARGEPVSGKMQGALPQAGGAKPQPDPTARISPDAKVLAMVGTKSPDAAAVAARAASDAAAEKADQEKQERAAFTSAAEQIRDAIRGDKLLAELSSQIAIDQTPEGLRIQLLDEDRRPMFALGSSTINERARLLLQKMAPVLMKLSEPIAIAGHTDATPYKAGEKGNWELSSERANATRRILTEAGVPELRIRSVTGNADRDLLLPADPMAAANRRIAIVVLRGGRTAATDIGKIEPQVPATAKPRTAS